jgi:hypothetical protein
MICLGFFAAITFFLPWQKSDGIKAVDERKPYSMPWTDSSPFYPSEWKTEDHKLVNWRSVPSATYCAECHIKEFKEWSSSIHAITGPDAIYESTILENEFNSQHGGKYATEKIRWCDGCHEPLGILAGEGTPVPAVGPNEAIEEGATCVLCHTATAADPLAGNAGLTLNINELKRYLDPALIMAAPEQHARSMQAKTHNPMMGESEFCGACHTEIRPTRINGDFPLHMQETYDEWRLSGYAEQGIECQNCHMHPEPAKYIEALNRGEKPKREVSHRFVGNNYLLTASDLPNNLVVALRGGWLRGKNVFMTEQEWLADLKKQQGLILDLLKESAELEVKPISFVAGKTGKLAVNITNSGAGHNLPTGALDQRHMWVEVKVTTTDGSTVYHSGWFNEKEGYHDPEAITYMKMLYDDAGEVIDRHILFDVKRMQYTRKPIRAKETDHLDYEFPLPAQVAGPLKVEVRLWYRLAVQAILRNIEKQIVPAIDLKGVIIPPVIMEEQVVNVVIEGASEG